MLLVLLFKLKCLVQAKRDVLACSQTGSGKMAAFLLPIINNLLEEGVAANVGVREQSPQVIVVSPTRELANQVNIT